MHEQVRDQVREFGANEVMPHAEHIHRQDLTIPEEFIEKMAEDPLFTQVMQDWGETMQEVGSEMEESGEAVEGAFEKYGIDPSAE